MEAQHLIVKFLAPKLFNGKIESNTVTVDNHTMPYGCQTTAVTSHKAWSHWRG